MSRVGKNPVAVPDGVQVAVDGQDVSVKGKLGEMAYTVNDEVEVGLDDSSLWVKPRSQTKRARSLWGTSRARLQNLVTGVTQGFTVELEITGVGYRAAVEGKALNLQLGYSHEVKFPIPEGVSIACPTPTQISLTGIDKQQVGQAAAVIRAYRPPEPYKGKGIKYRGEQILRKEGKKK
jgi:large subunit ribosomal protein L6